MFFKKIKKFFLLMRNVLENLISYIFLLYPLKNIIIFESVPDLSDNTMAVFDEMIYLGLNKKYKMIWLVKKIDSDLPKLKNVSYFLISDMNFKCRMQYRKLKMTAKCLISCNAFLISYRKKQVSFYLSHGTPIKRVKGYYNIPQKVDYCLAASSSLIDLISDQFKCKREKIVPIGFPRNDFLTKSKKDIHCLFEVEHEKIIVWYPTFRQHKSGVITASQNALPIIHDKNTALELNEYAKACKILIVLKPHFAQDLNYIENLKLSNILFINDNFFIENKINSYEFVAGCDALITDYSSIYFDYMLCDKPIALIWEDYDKYKENPGFAIDMNLYMKGAEKIYSINDFKRFIKNVAIDNDAFKQERNKINEVVNYSNDGNNSYRVVAFILKKLQQN